MGRIKTIVSIFIVFFFGMKAFAGFSVENLVFGPEWTFRDSYKLPDRMDGLRDRKFIKIIEKKCKALMSCRVDRYGVSGPEIIFDSELTVIITEDFGVIEMRATPLTYQGWKSRAALVQDVIFDSMAEYGIKPDEREGAGHLNMGVKEFLNRPEILRDFIVDFMNHQGVGVVLNSLTANQEDAAYPDQMKFEDQENLVRHLKQSLDLRAKEAQEIIYHLTKALYAKFFSLSLVSISSMRGDFQNIEREKRIIFDTFSLDPEARLEIRTLRPQQNFREYLQAMEIFMARIKYLQKSKKKIKLNPPAPMEDGWKALGEFADYLTESGLKWQRYKNLIPAIWRDLPEEFYVRKTTDRSSQRCSQIH